MCVSEPHEWTMCLLGIFPCLFLLSYHDSFLVCSISHWVFILQRLVYGRPWMPPRSCLVTKQLSQNYQVDVWWWVAAVALFLVSSVVFHVVKSWEEPKDEAKGELFSLPSFRVGARAAVQRCTHCRASATVADIGRTDCRGTGCESWSGALHV